MGDLWVIPDVDTLICGTCGWSIPVGVFGLGAIIMEEHMRVSHNKCDGVDNE